MPKRQSDEDILATARERFRLAETAEAEIRREALDDLRFCAGDQWDATDRQRRTLPGSQRPCLTINKLAGPLNQTANEARLNQAGIKVSPVDSTGDPDTAEVLEGMIRHIEQTSKADEVYETAIEQSAAGSFGYFRVTTRYCGAKSFDQEIRIERIADPFSAYIDPYAREADKSDMRWAFECEWVPKEEYEEDYGDSVVSKMNFYSGGQNPAPGWIGDSGVRIARYWTVETTARTLAQIEWPDGTRTAQYKDEVPAELPEGLRLATDADGKPLERETEERRILCRKINGVEILDETEWRGQWIPILVVLGKEMVYDGERKLFSLVRFAKDPQKLYNFARSSEAETLLLGTKAPWIGVKGIFKDKRWETANSVPWAYIEYEPLDIAGNPAQAPMRNQFEPPIQALSLTAAQAADDIKSTTAIFDASLGSQGNETSGVAIRQRQSQAGLSNAHFIDNLNRAIRQCGVILCDLIPKIYNTPREIRILGEDRKEQIVKVNQQYVDPQGRERCYDLSSGQYDVTISVGPSYSTQRQETWDVLTQLAQAYPQLMQIAGDVLFSNADFPGAQQLADRFRKTLPPGMAEQAVDNQQQMQMLASQAQQQAQMIQQLTGQLQAANEDLRTKRMETESQERIEIMKIESSDRQAATKAQVDLVAIEAKLSSTENITALKLQVAALERQIARMASGAAAEEAVGPSPAQPATMQPPPAAPTPAMPGM